MSCVERFCAVKKESMGDLEIMGMLTLLSADVVMLTAALI
jgi:hypothetical protein